MGLTLPAVPDHDAIRAAILERWPETVVAEMDGATFFLLDPGNWPNYATVVWTDAFDVERQAAAGDQKTVTR